MITLPKNCKVSYNSNNVTVRMVYSTQLPVGEYNGIKVYQPREHIIDINGRRSKGKNYFALEFNVPYQNNMPHVLHTTYFEYKKKAMLFNRMKKQEELQRQIGLLSNDPFPGTHSYK
jgi:hypothetical protein